MQDFTAGAIAATPSQKTQTTGSTKVDDLVKQLVAESGCTKSCELVEEMVITALKLGKDQTTTASTVGRLLPGIPQFLEWKHRLDPSGVLTSDQARRVGLSG